MHGEPRDVLGGTNEGSIQNQPAGKPKCELMFGIISIGYKSRDVSNIVI